VALSLLALGLVACSGCGPSQAEVRQAMGIASDGTATAHAEGYDATVRQMTRAAVHVASPLVDAAVAAFRYSGEPAWSATCAGLLERGQHTEAIDCAHTAAEAGHNSPSVRVTLASGLMATEEFESARAVLFTVRDDVPDYDGLSELLLSAFSDDPMFLREVVTLESGVHLDLIRSLGGGSTISLKFKLDDVNVAAFKPNQTRRQTNYRAEVAAYRLCPMMRCGFEVPYSFQARISRRLFRRLYRISSLDPEFLATHEGYASNFIDLVWTEDDDGTFLHGVWKDWVPQFTQFPIEFTRVWDDWVDVDGDATLLDVPFAEAIEPLRGRERGRYHELLEEAGDITTRGLAQQISNMLAFDFLINNWDRFSGIYFGVNCQFADGQFVSIDNGAGFMTREPDRPRERLHLATRFSRSLVEEVRRMDRDALMPILFPDTTADEVRMYEAFWERRQEFLDYVDGLIETHGEDAVLFFE